MRATLKDGTVIEGTAEQVNRILAAMGQTPNATEWYHSESKGWVPIATMETTHIRNAMLKMYREWVTTLSTYSGQHLIILLRDGPTNQTFAALLTEYIKRTNV